MYGQLLTLLGISSRGQTDEIAYHQTGKEPDKAIQDSGNREPSKLDNGYGGYSNHCPHHRSLSIPALGEDSQRK